MTTEPPPASGKAKPPLSPSTVSLFACFWVLCLYIYIYIFFNSLTLLIYVLYFGFTYFHMFFFLFTYFIGFLFFIFYFYFIYLIGLVMEQKLYFRQHLFGVIVLICCYYLI